MIFGYRKYNYIKRLGDQVLKISQLEQSFTSQFLQTPSLAYLLDFKSHLEDLR